MRLGVFGGTFDPPHVGHLIVASDAFDVLRLDRLLFIPSAQPPHKSGVHATPEQRLALTRAATRGDDRFEVDALELERTGASYTADTLRILRDRYPDAEIFLLVGADAAREMHTWHRPDEVARLARIAVLSREGDDDDFGDDVIPVRVTRIDVSSTDLRERVGDGRSIRYLVPDSILAEVEDIYGTTLDPRLRGNDGPLTGHARERGHPASLYGGVRSGEMSNLKITVDEVANRSAKAEQDEAVREILRLSRSSEARRGDRAWSRDELHERR